MTKTTAIIGTILSVTLCGCGSKPVQETESYTFPAIGTVATRGIGDSLIRQDTGLLIPEIDIQSDTMIGNHRLSKGRYDYEDTNSTGTWYLARGQSFYVRKTDNQICIHKTKECAPAQFTIEKKLSSLSTDSFQQTLLYNGKIGNRVTLGYREFSNNLARAAFSNNVDYDLSESMVVGYKGARLEIIKATNTEITYRVVAGFPK